MSQGSERNPKKIEQEQKATRYALIAAVAAFLWHIAGVRLGLNDAIFRSVIIGGGVYAVIRFDVFGAFFEFFEGIAPKRPSVDDEQWDQDDFDTRPPTRGAESKANTTASPPPQPQRETGTSKQAHSLLPGARVYTIKMPRGIAWQPEMATSLVLRLADEGIVFAITAEFAAIRWQILDLRKHSFQMEEQIRGAILAVYPEAEVESESLVEPQSPQRFYRGMFSIAQHVMFQSSILYPSELRSHDPLTLLGNTMGELLPDERFTYFVCLGNVSQGLISASRRMMERSGTERFFGNMVLGALKSSASMSSERFTDDIHKQFLEKMEDRSGQLFAAYLLVEIDTSNFERLMHLATGVEATFIELSGSFQSLGVYGETDRLFYEVTSPVRAQTTSIYTALVAKFRELTRKTVVFDIAKSNFGRLKLDVKGTPSGYIPGECCVFNTKELATLWHLPHDGFIAPTIYRVNTRRVRIPAVLRGNTSGVCLGNNIYGGVETPVHMLDDDRKAHMIILGKTEMGKSTLMHQMVEYDIAQGHGVAVLDPEGTLIQGILQYSIPDGREDDVIVLDVANTEYPIPLNPLFVADPENRHDAAAVVLDIFSKLEPKFRGTRMSHDLGDILETLMASKQVTLRDIRKLMDDDTFRDTFIEGLSDEAAFEFWDDVDAMRGGERDARFGHLSHRLRDFYRGPVMYPIICHPEGLDFTKLIHDNRIILVSLKDREGAKVSEKHLDLLGKLIVTQFQIAASAGAAQKPYYFYVDEADRFVTTSIPEMYKRARKRNIHLALATQYLDNLIGDAYASVMGNTGAILTFQCSDNDARVLERYMRPSFTAEDLVKLDRHDAALFMKFRGQQLPAFSLRTNPILERIGNDDDPNSPHNTELRIREKSVKNFTPVHRETVTKWLNERYPKRTTRKRDKQEEEQEKDEKYGSWEGEPDPDEDG